MSNRYSVLASDNGIHENENKTDTCVNLSRITTSMPKTNTNYNKQECTNLLSPLKELRKREESRPNLQNKSIPSRQNNFKGTNEKFTISTITNKQILQKVSITTSVQRTTLPKEMKPKTVKRHDSQIHSSHNLLLLGSSHVRGLAERIGCSLGSFFNVCGTTKPNTDIKGITSPSYFTPDNLTKNDMIIFCGGTRDISRNESKSGLCSLKDFAQRTSNTNVILLEAPLRYDLPLSSCVNNEVKLLNKRMRSLMAPFNHVKVVSIPTGREHHTRHGLHLNKKGKHWVTENLVKEIRNLYLPPNIHPPIVLQWKDIKKNTTHRINPAAPIQMCEVVELPRPDVTPNSGWIIEVRGVQEEEESKQHPTLNSDQTQTVLPQQVKVPNRVSSR